MFSAFKKLTKGNDDRCPAPTPMSSSFQKKFSRGVHFNMKILIKGDRNVGKSCLLQRLQGGPFTEDYVPTEQIQVAPIHWAYKNSDYIVKVEVWEVVDKGKTKKKPPLGLKLENQSAPTVPDDGYETPVLDATFLDVYKNASGVILMLDITKPWTFEYVVKELSRVPADLPVAVLGNHCDMQHHRQVHAHHIDQALHHARLTRTAPIRYAESSMRNGFGLRLLHKFLSIPFLRLQKTSLLEQLQRNQKDMEEIEKDLNEFQRSEECQYDVFVERLARARRQGAPAATAAPERAPSIVLGAGRPIVPNNVNPLLAQSLNPTAVQVPSSTSDIQPSQTYYVSPELLKPKPTVSMDVTPTKQQPDSDISSSGMNVTVSSGALEEFYAGTLDSSFLEDLAPITNINQEAHYEVDSDDDNNITNPKVTVDEDDLDFECSPTIRSTLQDSSTAHYAPKENKEEQHLRDLFTNKAYIKDSIEVTSTSSNNIFSSGDQMELSLHNDFPLWAGDSSVRRSPEGGEDPDVNKEPDEKVDKKHKKKKSKDRGDISDKAERKEKKNKLKKSKSQKESSKQQDLLAPSVVEEFNYEEYDSI